MQGLIFEETIVTYKTQIGDEQRKTTPQLRIPLRHSPFILIQIQN